MSQPELCQSFTAVHERLEQALNEANRPSDAALLLAVSKTKPANMLREAYALGQRHFGENYLQEALDKQASLADLDDIVWHFIGPLQSNKTRQVAEHFHWMHSIEREKIASRLSRQRPAHLPALQVCIQVNISDEASKSGVALDKLDDLAASIIELPGLSLRGLMAIPAPSQGILEQRKPYARLRETLEALRARFPGAPLDTLSMGMSADMEAAVAEGATLLRVGTALFGRRDTA